MKIKSELIKESQQDVDKLVELLYPKFREALMKSYLNGFFKALNLSNEDLKQYIEE